MSYCRPAQMKAARKKPTAANLRSWRVIIIRSKGEYLGSVEAPDRERAEAVATKQFALDDNQRSWLLIRERA
jgi:nitroreductase